MNEWILTLDAPPGDGPRLAVKDAIDVVGAPTTVGCRAIADLAVPAAADAPCVATARAAGARIVGKTNLHELCFGTTGLNPTFGDPVNPRWPDLVPGGSSSGSAVAIVLDEADVAYGTDTGGSVRLPAACCGIAGLKTTHGRMSIEGIWPLAPSLDTVGPLARDVAGLVVGMQLLEPTFSVAGVGAAPVLGRVASPEGVVVDPRMDAVVDAALTASGIAVEPVALEGWAHGDRGFALVIGYEAWRSDAAVMEIPGGVHEYVAARLRGCANIDADAYAEGQRELARWRDEVLSLLTRVPVLALPTLVGPPPPTTESFLINALTHPFNGAGTPALSIPVGDGPGESLQLVAAPGGEELLLATAAVIEAAWN
ncbi:MAG TPA: amidase [Acidimicrobiales bacterium]|nr:amidase [Acidimicrobiales bacterium]